MVLRQSLARPPVLRKMSQQGPPPGDVTARGRLKETCVRTAVDVTLALFHATLVQPVPPFDEKCAIANHSEIRGIDGIPCVWCGDIDEHAPGRTSFPKVSEA